MTRRSAPPPRRSPAAKASGSAARKARGPRKPVARTTSPRRRAGVSRRGHLVVLSGPSGVGKTTVAAHLLADPAFSRAVTATTRAPRPGEVDGRDYRFLSAAAFQRAVTRGEFLEHAEVHGRRYGTPKAEVHRVVTAGRICLLVIDVQGAATLRSRGVPALFVFLAPPGEKALRNRLLGRGTEADAERRLRLENALRRELPRAKEFDAVVVNDDVERAAAEIRRLVEARLTRN